jgi:hypothetical protein
LHEDELKTVCAHNKVEEKEEEKEEVVPVNKSFNCFSHACV